MIYAGFWKRFAAALIDGLITTILGVIVGGFFEILYGYSTRTSAGAESLLIVGLLVGWIYFSSFESSNKQATLGKMALGVKVTDLKGHRIGFGKASVRYFGKFLSTLIIFIGYIMVAFTKRKQGLHDIITSCLVVNREDQQNHITVKSEETS